MIFTIGFQVAYDPGLVTHGTRFKKIGRTGTYKGGSVWLSKLDAQQHIKNNQPRLSGYAVYGVIADWDSQTEQLPGEPFRRLLVDSQIVVAK